MKVINQSQKISEEELRCIMYNDLREDDLKVDLNNDLNEIMICVQDNFNQKVQACSKFTMH